MMRTYPRNSPQAAARILALAMLADGHLCNRELAALKRLGAHELLGLQAHELHAVVHEFREDLLACGGMRWAEACLMDPRRLRQLMDEVDDPDLRLKVLGLCVSLIEADQQLADSERIVFAAAVEHWGLHGSATSPALTAQGWRNS
ncbi:MAG: TerB family tellurite resistance protein [Polaromonas sp.]|jgi:uncharacterized tellurite resistance protein B-like protein|uniref:tellurite resistance TerB family protein n=1 Tax=Polaromonas sp. TaxID=1869339 RepID=UPI0027310BAB|nr:TerB family tellurite resistance protein [Polaromonas sp.]MDP2257462.1 TerB family tellurite resistance protein [Polaromonas sp.]MDP3707263.1 TerB family tellurite resistance protein [Polaromonas sp.]